jgi:hypothetical protein
VPLTRAAADSAVAREKYTGMWTVALAAKRLVEAGFAVTVTDSAINYPHLSVPGKYIRLGRGDLHAFFYPDTNNAKADVARLDSLTAAPPGVTIDWPSPPTMVRSLNLIVIFLSNSPSSSDRLANAILGGLMPPERKK